MFGAFPELIHAVFSLDEIHHLFGPPLFPELIQSVFSLDEIPLLFSLSLAVDSLCVLARRGSTPVQPFKLFHDITIYRHHCPLCPPRLH